MKDVEAGVRELILHLGENPDREGLRGTPRRVREAYEEMTEGYRMDPAEVLGVDFEAGGYDQIIALPDIEFTSLCEHHLLPFVGVAHVAYLPNPNGRVVGLSKLARLVDIFARRLQIQERMTKQIAEALEEHLKPKGVGVVVKAQHMCMALRGVRKERSRMVTSAMLGCFRERGTTRDEFLRLCGM